MGGFRRRIAPLLSSLGAARHLYASRGWQLARTSHASVIALTAEVTQGGQYRSRRKCPHIWV